MPPAEVEAEQTDTIGIKVLKFIRSLGHYGMIVGAVQAAYGVYRWEKIQVVVGICGAIFSFGWMMLWDWLVAKVAARA